MRFADLAHDPLSITFFKKGDTCCSKWVLTVVSFLHRACVLIRCCNTDCPPSFPASTAPCSQCVNFVSFVRTTSFCAYNFQCGQNICSNGGACQSVKNEQSGICELFLLLQCYACSDPQAPSGSKITSSRLLVLLLAAAAP